MKKRSNVVCLAVIMFVSSVGVICRSQQNPCPTPPNRVNGSVGGTVSYNPSTQIFTYSYTVSNAATSQQEIDSFSLDVEPPVINPSAPKGWNSSMFANSPTIGWDAVLVSANVPDDGISIPPSIVQIKRGNSLAGFSFQTAKVPGFVKYYLSGFSPIPVQQEEEGAEALAETCPQSIGNLLDLAVVGSTLGPTNAVPVAIDVTPGKFPNRIDLEEQRTVTIAVLGSATFDVTKVDSTSLQAGPGKAPSIDSRPIFEDVNQDGIPDLVAHFNVKALGLRCTDTALFLIGKMLDGTAFGGADSVVIVDCE